MPAETARGRVALSPRAARRRTRPAADEATFAAASSMSARECGGGGPAARRRDRRADSWKAHKDEVECALVNLDEADGGSKP